MATKQVFHDHYNAKESFELINTLNSLSIKAEAKVFINWSKFKKIDTLYISDLDKYFYDIWFPAADDIDIFDDSLEWVLSIRHDGVISFTKY